MAIDYLTDLKYLGLISRIKRLSDNTLTDGRKLYRYIDLGIEPNWFLIFGIIIEKGESSVSEISSILKFAHPSIIAIVKKMEKAGYLEIQSSTVDKRKQIIKLSEKATQQLPEMQAVWKACEQAVASLFTDDTFLGELKKLEAALEKESFFDRVLNHLTQDDIRIRPFALTDTKQFALLNQRWLKKYFSLEAPDKVVLKNPTQHIIGKGGHIFMADYRNQAVGTVALLPQNNLEVELCRMAVDPDFQGKGIGKKLLEKAIDLAKEASYDSIILYSNTQLEAAVHLYKKLGFSPEALEADILYERANVKMRLKLT